MGSRKERISKSNKTRKTTKLVNSKTEALQENVTDSEEQEKEVWWKNTVVGVLAHPAIMNSKNENKPRD